MVLFDVRFGGRMTALASVRVGRWQDTLPGTYDPDRAVVVTDPPYGLAASGGMGNGAPGIHSRGRHQADTRSGHETDKGYEDTIPWGRHVEEVLALLPAKRHVIRGPATALIRRDYPQPRRVCVEVAAYRRRAGDRPGVVPYLWQGWAVYGRIQIERHAKQATGDAYAGVLPGRRDPRHHGPMTSHRALTPFGACLWMVDTWVDPGCLVLDPFAGLGTIGIAALTLGFEYLGSELVPEYAKVAQDALVIGRPTLGLEIA